MNGRRIEIEPGGIFNLLPGDYGRDPFSGHWFGRPPGTDLVGDLSNHTIIENADGTITVSPSILIRGTNDAGNPISWHGYLEFGFWREV